MTQKLRLLAVLAHPDDESLGFGGTLAKYAAEGVETYLVTATRGERGRFGSIGKGAEPVEVGRVREAELRTAAAVLGIREVSILNYPDGAVDQVEPTTAIGAVVQHLRRIQPDVVVTFGPDGAYGHPDHIAISQFTTAAIMAAASPAFPEAPRPHAVSKFYYIAWPQSAWTAYQTAFRKLVSTVDGIERQAVPWPDWAITTVIDTRRFWSTVWRAVCCHESQVTAYERLKELSPNDHEALWGRQSFYRVFSTVTGGRVPETDLMEGINKWPKNPQ